MKKIIDFLLGPLSYLGIGIIDFAGGFGFLIFSVVNRTFSFACLFSGFALMIGCIIICESVIDSFKKRKSSGSPDDK